MDGWLVGWSICRRNSSRLQISVAKEFQADIANSCFKHCRLLLFTAISNSYSMMLSRTFNDLFSSFCTFQILILGLKISFSFYKAENFR